MSTEYHSVLVIFDRDIREESVEHIVDLIRHIKYVQDVVPNAADADSAMAEARARKELGSKLWEVLEGRR